MTSAPFSLARKVDVTNDSFPDLVGLLNQGTGSWPFDVCIRGKGRVEQEGLMKG